VSPAWGGATTCVSAAALSLPAAGSASTPSIAAVAWMVPRTPDATAAWMITERVDPAAVTPRSQSTVDAVCVQVGGGGVTDVTTASGASVAVKLDADESEGPAFVAAAVYVSVAPEMTGSGTSASVSPRSASGVRTFVSVAVLLDGTGSTRCSARATVAWLTSEPTAEGATVAVSV
jgi:hypothetical protein